MHTTNDKMRGCATETLIGAGTVVTGDIVFCGGLRIDGEVRGNVRCLSGPTGTLVIGEKGCVDGEVAVARVIVNGLVTGRIEAGEFIRIQSKARIDGDVDYAIAEIHAGAVIQGRLVQAHSLAELAPGAEQDTPAQGLEAALAAL